MLKRSALALAALVLLSGCSSTPSGPDAGDLPSQTFTATGDNKVAAAVTTDRLHFLERPHVTAREPTAQEPVRVPVPSIFEESLKFPNGFRDTWNFTPPAEVRGFVGQATLVVEVKGGVAGNPFPTSDGCFWALGVTVDQGGPGREFDLGCLPEGAQVPAGIYVLEFPFAYPDAVIGAGSVVHFEFHTNENIQRPPGSSVELLTASVPYDSVVDVYGLQLPVDPALLLQTTA
jgi:hypothetical protein